VAPRKEPVRTCVGCRLTGAKRELLRVVRGPDGAASLDRSGKAKGRGAYLHRDPACWEAALGRGSLSRALGHGLTPDEAGTLLAGLRAASQVSRGATRKQ